MAQNSYDISERILTEVKDLANEITKIETVSGLISYHQKVQSLYEKASFLKMLEEEEIDVHQRKSEMEALEAANPTHEKSEEATEAAKKIEQEYDEEMEQDEAFNDFRDLERSNDPTERKEPTDEARKKPSEKEEIENGSDDEKNSEVEPKIEEGDGDSENDVEIEEKSETNDKEKQKHDSKENHKVKLASIKKMQQNTGGDNSPSTEQKERIKLDLNDKLAFSKKLFDGDEDEMNQVLTDLKEMKSLKEAKEYLSDLYHDRKWKDVDEYAQRLWQSVEDQLK